MRRAIGGLGLNPGLLGYEVRRWALVAVLPALAVALLTDFGLRASPATYRATTTLYVQQAQAGAPGVAPDPSASAALAGTYAQMITDPVILAAADRRLQGRFPGYRVEAHEPTAGPRTAQQGSQLVGISVTDTVPARAATAANSIARAFVRRIQGLERARFSRGRHALAARIATAGGRVRQETARIAAYRGVPSGLATLRTQLAADTTAYQTLLAAFATYQATAAPLTNPISVFSAAVPPTSPTSPRPVQIAVLVGFLILLLAGGLLRLWDRFTDLPRTAEEVEEVIGAPVLGVVPRYPASTGSSEPIVRPRPRSPEAEAYHRIWTNLRFTDAPPATIVVASALPGEGKSTIAANLARACADGCTRVALVDADLRRPTLHHLLARSEAQFQGLTTMLEGDELNGHSAVDLPDRNLALVPSGPVPANPAGLLGSTRMQAVLRRLRDQASMVVIDSPPVLDVVDAAILATMVDGVVLVVDPSRARRHDLRQARVALEAVGGRILGVVINRLHPHGSLYYRWYGSYSHRDQSVVG